MRDRPRRAGPGRRGAGDPERAGRLLGAAESDGSAPGFFNELLVFWRPESASSGEAEAALRRALAGYPRAPTWIEVGRRLPLERAVDEAVALVEDGPDDESTRPPAAPPAGAPPPAPPPTSREREVAVLVARGATNRQIAASLVIAEGTAMRHLEHILNKLGVHSRAEIAAWAARRGLDGPDGSA